MRHALDTVWFVAMRGPVLGRRRGCAGRVFPAVCLGLLLAPLAGCRSPAGAWSLQSDGPTWPRPPQPGRVRYLNELRGSEGFLPPERGLAAGWRNILFGPERPTTLVTPHAVAVHPERPLVAVADTNAGHVVLFDIENRRVGIVPLGSTAAGSGDASGTGPADRPGRSEAGAGPTPVGVAWLGDALAVADARAGHILIVDDAASSGRGGPDPADARTRVVGEGDLQRPAGLAAGPGGNRLYVTDAAAHAVVGFSAAGELLFRVGRRGTALGEFNHPSQIACGPDGRVFVADTMNFRIQQLTADGSPVSYFGRKGNAAGDFSLPKGVAVDPDGNLWVVDAHFENVQAFTRDGRLLLSLGREGAGPGEFWLPAGIAIDPMRRMWIADTYNRRVQVFELVR